MTVRIREAGVSDVAAILPCYEWLFAAPGSRPTTWDEQLAERSLTEAVGSPDSAILVAVGADDSVIGVCSAYLDLRSVRYGLRCWVEDLAIHPGHRSSGIGAGLLDRAREWARERGATHLELDTGTARVDAQRFYERLEPETRTLAYGWRL